MDRAGLRRWTPLVQIALFTAASTGLRPMLSYRAIELGASGVELGILATCQASLAVVFAFGIGRRMDRDGPFRYLLAGQAAFLVGGVLAALAPNLVLLLLSAPVVGLGELMTFLAQQAVAALAPPERRDRSFGQFSSSIALGQVLGPLLTGLAASGRPTALPGMVVGLVLCTVAVPWSLGARGLVADVGPAGGGSGRLALRIVRTGGMWQALFSSAIVLVSTDLLTAFLPLWAQNRGISVGLVGVLLAVRGVFTMLSRLGSGTLIRALGRRVLMAVSLVVGACALAVLPLVGLAGAVATMVVLGAGLGLAQALTMSWVSLVSAPGTIAAALGIRMTANRLAQATLPALVALVAAGAGASGVFWSIATLLAGASVTLVRAPMGDGSG